MNEVYVKKYADMLGITLNTNDKEIIAAYNIWYNKWSKKTNHNGQDYKELIDMQNARDVLLKYVKDKYKNKGKENNNPTISKPIKVVESEKAPEDTINIGNKILAALTATALATTIMAYIMKNNTSSDKKDTEVPSSSIATEATEIDEVENNDLDIVDTKINDDSFMRTLAANEWEKIQKIKNNNFDFAPTIADENVVYELIRWAHHSDINYTGEYILSNEDANARLFELVSSQYDITNLFEGLSCYNNIKSLGSKIAMMDSENSSYNDEYDAYMVIQNSINNMDLNNYAEVITIRVIAKYMISDAKNETMRDIVFDKSNLDAAKVSQCKQIFEAINSDSVFKNALNAAKNEDEANKARSLKL